VARVRRLPRIAGHQARHGRAHAYPA
jgi:hypothetical protein